jgi:hypothetical protein
LPVLYRFRSTHSPKALKKQDGGPSVEIKLERKGAVVYQESRLVDRKALAKEWTNYREQLTRKLNRCNPRPTLGERRREDASSDRLTGFLLSPIPVQRVRPRAERLAPDRDRNKGSMKFPVIIHDHYPDVFGN